MHDIQWGVAIDVAVTSLFPACVVVLLALGSRQAVRMRIKSKGFRWRDVALAAVLLAGVVTWATWVMIRDESFACAAWDSVSGACLDANWYQRDRRSPTDRAADALTVLLLLGGGAVAGFAEGFGRKSPPVGRNSGPINAQPTAPTIAGNRPL
jgi:hypothetical protein